MRRVVPKQSFKHIFLMLFLTVFSLIMIYMMIISENDELLIAKYTHVQNRLVVNETSKKKVNYEIDEKLMTRSNHEWIINKNIIQYSSQMVIFQSEFRYKIESIIILKQRINTESIRCIVKDKYNNIFVFQSTEVYFNSYEVQQQVIYYGKSICEFQAKSEFSVDNIVAVAIIDAGMYITELDSSKFEYIMFQRPEFVQASVPKKQAVAHCVHRVNLLNDVKLRSLHKWLSIQKELGYHEIKLYFFNYNKGYDDIIRSDYGDFVKIIYHENQDIACYTQQILAERNPNVELFDRLYIQCFEAASIFMDIDEFELIGLHEKLNGNDCYMGYRHVFEIVTNYDFDELIIPHRLNASELPLSSEQMVCDENSTNLNNYNHSFNIYVYYDYLFEIFGREKTACLRLEHSILVSYSADKLDRLINDLDYLISNDTRLPNTIRYAENMQYVDFRVTKEDVSYAKQLISNYNLALCFYKYHINNTSANLLNFYKFFTIIAPVRLGKSIYNTNLTEIINQHSADIFNNDEKGLVNLPLKFGYLSHFREDYHGLLLNKTYNLKYAYVDIDYLILLNKTNYHV